ncbi:MAG TPA: class I SAM-dependent methyltransferase [Acidimicrobiales bacterium]|nr:class I SAM-dependent methyltransferase [Acidimicrobiales bacterium]
MPRQRDVQAFDDRSSTYESDWRGRMHHDIAARTARVALAAAPRPQRVLDVGCGTGMLLRMLAEQLPQCLELVGLDPAPAMVGVARSRARDPRLAFSVGQAEHLPHPDGSFDLVVSTTSFDHWEDQGAGLRECARVLRPEGRLVVSDLFSWWLAPTLVLGRRSHARTRRRAQRLLETAGFESVSWRRLYMLVIGTAVASK